MPKTFPIRLEVEEIALGTVLRKLNDMPGIVKFNLDLGQGGLGAGKDHLQQQAATNNKSLRDKVINLLMTNSPMNLKTISSILKVKFSAVAYHANKLKKAGIIASAGHATWRMADGYVSDSAASPKISHGPAGRATPGSSVLLLKTLLAAGPLTAHDLRTKLAAAGLSMNSTSGAFHRAKKLGIIRKNDFGYELTNKGQKIEGVPANG